MKLMEDRETEVFVNDGGGITISQPGACFNCGSDEGNVLTFPSHRARLVAAELIKLANEIDSQVCD